jgi:hypothetical protein
MIIIIFLLFISLWFFLDRHYPYETFISVEKENELRRWFDLATDLKTEISCIENFS